MPIPVTCPSCHARFQVSDKFAGLSGPCPKCKFAIKIPEKAEEVVIHAPDEFGPKDTSGRAVLKPLERDDAQPSPVALIASLAICLACLIVAFFLRQSYAGKPDGVPWWMLACGAFALGPPLAVAGYSLLRDSELQPHRGITLWIRALICGGVYALLWAGYAYLKINLFDGEMEMFQLVFVAPVLIVLGGLIGMGSMELNFTNGALHYAIYLAATCLMRVLIGMKPY